MNTSGKGVDWALLSAALLYTVGFLTIAPLSSSLLDSIAVDVQRPSTFEQIAAQQLAFDPSQDVYLRTVAHTLQHLEPSAWVTDDYAVLPFYPSSLTKVPLGPILTDRPQQWSAMTTALKSVMTCEPMRITETSASAYHKPMSDKCAIGNCVDNYNYTYQATTVSDNNGCDIRIFSSREDDYSYPNQLAVHGGGSWFIAPNFTYDTWAIYSDPQTINFTEQCLDREFIYASSPWTFENPDFPKENWTVTASALAKNSTILSYSCDTKFYMARLKVLASSSGNQVTTISFDDEDFRQHQAEIPSAVFNTALFQRTWMAANWSSLIYNSRTYSNEDPSMGGPLRLLSAAYGLDLGALLDDSERLKSAYKLKQRFFGEMLISAIASHSMDSGSVVRGQILQNEQRIVVNSAIAITLTVLLLLSAGLLLLLFLICGSRRRPLDLNNDPANLAVVASLALHDPVTRRLFVGTEALTTLETADVLKETRHRLSEGDLLSTGQRLPLQSSSKRVGSWRPRAIQRRSGLALLVFLCALLATILSLWLSYGDSGLYGSTVLYRADFTIRDSTFAVAPYSIVPTLLAVCLSLWWGSLEQTFRRIQPYVSMANRPTSMRRGPLLSYVSSYLIWGAWKAASHRHWILALLCLGATFAEIFTVAMSALWQRAPGLVHDQASVNTRFALRNDSQIFTVGSQGSGSAANPVPGEVLGALYGSLEVNWLYGATLQLAYNASEPAWSKDGWSFMPLDIANVQNASSSAGEVKSDSIQDQQVLLDAALVNVTVATVATRARLECSPFEGLSNLSAWVTEVYLTNSSRWNISANPTSLEKGYELGTPLWDDYGYLREWSQMMELLSYGHRVQTSFFANPSRLQCCADNRTQSIKPAGVGYWSQQTMIDGEYMYVTDRAGTQGPNFTTKWIHGFPSPRLYYDNQTTDGHMIWRDLPRLTALNCKPIIESAPAEVTTDRADGSVQSFHILEKPTPIGRPAWNNSYDNFGFVDAKPVVGGLQNIATRYAQPSLKLTVFANTFLTSYGFLFLDGMLRASDLTTLGGVDVLGYPDHEPTEDRTFNFRKPGLNMDFMTYAMYSLAGSDLEALLDPEVQARTANKVFSTFFQHFASSNVTSQGSWTYQAVQESQKVEATVTRRLEMLQMSMTATAICLTILAFFVVVTIIVYFVDYKHSNNLQHDVDSMADVLRLVCDSPKLLAWLASRREASEKRGNKTSELDDPKVKLDMFRGTDGQMKWIVEIVDDDDDGRKEKLVHQKRRRINLPWKKGKT